MRKILPMLGLIGFLGFIGLVGTWEATYTRDTVCTGHVGNVYTFTDTCGYMWDWEAEETESFEMGETYKLIMDDCHSTSIHDDWIKKIKKN